MMKYNLYILIFSVFFPLGSFAFDISGTVTDRAGIPVINARVRFINSKDALDVYEAYTDHSGYYSDIKAVAAEGLSAGPSLLFCYPNPFNRQTVISFYLGQRQRVEVAIYNIVGQKIRVVADAEFDEGRCQMVWDGLSGYGTPVVPGVYFCFVHSNQGRTAFKIIILGGENIATPVWSSGGESGSNSPAMFTAYVSGDGFITHHVDGIDLATTTTKNFVIDRTVWTPFSTTGNYLGIYNGEDYAPMFIKGINIGTAVPGAWPGQLAVSADQYARWFRMIADAGFNTIRIYTLHYPRFYEEFARYNKENPDKPLYLLQGVWLDEEYPVSYIPDLYTMTDEFDRDIHDLVDCLHGNKSLGHRYGYAYGNFTVDVSKWVLGMVIGREVHAYEIDETDDSNSTIKAYSGAHLSITNASPSEAWVTERLDRLIAYERLKYNTNRPVAFSSWATLDPLTHPSESKNGFEDAASLDLNNIESTNAPGGFFISYHAYPYYPNFISKDEKYQNISDEMGLNPYLGYLRELKDHYANHPLLIAEFGLPTSWGNARYSPSGMNHGGINEEEQGKYTMRMFHNIYDTDYCGAVVFSWMDEWFKSTWITHPLTSSRRNLWHNISSPENNYGLIHFVPNPAYDTGKNIQNFNLNKISKASVWHDFAHFNVEVTLASPLGQGDTLWVAYDTYKRNMGESTLPNHQKVLNNRAEFLVRVTSDSARLFVTKAYNLQGVIHMNCYSSAFQTKATDGEPWIPYKWQNDETWLRPNIQDIGKLNICKGNETLGIHHAVQMRSDGVYIRIPWTLLQFSDPSSAMVIDDDTSPSFCLDNWACDMQYLNSIRSNEGIAVTMVYKNEVAEQTPYTWKDWDINSQEILNPNMFVEEEKASLSIIREGLKNTPFTPK